ncbi:MAG: peptide chain release factor N(5)-glutamine methyltransferase [Gemmatimonadales bacterium]
MPETLVRLGDLLREARAVLHEASIPEPARESRFLWESVAGGTSSRCHDPASTVDSGLVGRFALQVERRRLGEPLAYVTGVAGFRRLGLLADRRALIPRPETEGLIDLLLSRVRTGIAADLGTGSGCLALSLADEGEFGRVIAVDRSREALALTAENAGRTGFELSLVAGDWLSSVAEGTLDAVVSNPPYLTEQEYDDLDPSVREWEPAAALVSGPDGLAATAALLQSAPQALRPGGWIALELDCRRAKESAALAVAAGWDAVTVEHDLFGRARYLLAQRSQRQ